MLTCPVYLGILLLVIGSWLVESCGASNSSSASSSTLSTASPTSPTLPTSTSSATSTLSQSSIATWLASYCEAQLEIFDVNQDGTLQESEQTEFFQSILTSISSLSCTPQDIAAVQTTMIDLCGSNCRFQHAERAFCTVVAKAMQGHCTEQNNSTFQINTNITTLYFYYTVAFNISDHVTYSLQDRQQWLIDAFDQVAKTTWLAVPINPMQRQQRLRGPAQSSRTWRSFNQADIHHRTSNFSSHGLSSVPLSTNITSFQKLSGNDHWNVTHAVNWHLTFWNKNRYYPYRMMVLAQNLQSQLPQVLWDSLTLPPGVTLQPDPANSSMPTTDTPNPPTQYLQTLPPTVVPTDGLIPSALAEGLQIWMIVLIAVSGAMASGILYLVCFHARPKPISPPSTNHDNNNNNNGSSSNNNNNNHTSISITVTESSVNHKSHGQPETISTATPPSMNNNNNKDDNMKSIVVSTNTLATLDPTPPTTPIRNNVSPDQGQSNSQSMQGDVGNAAHTGGHGDNHTNDKELEEEKMEEKAAPPITGSPLPSSSQRTFPKTSLRNIGYQVDPTGRIVPISFLSDRDSCLHVFEDTSEAYSRRWSSSSSSSSSSSFPTSRRKDSALQVHQQQQRNILLHDDAGNDTNKHKEQENIVITSGLGTCLPPLHLTREISQVSSDGPVSPEQMVDESSYYSGVYYGEDDCDNDDDNNNSNVNHESHFVSSHDFQEDMVGSDIPVYGGVYYGSDGDDEPRAKARSVPHMRSVPMVDYFAGIHIGQNASTSSMSTLSKDQGHDGGEEWSVDSRRSRESSLMSAEEREWQRRLREDLLHPVKEDAAIVDTTVVNLSGFTTGRGETQRGNRRRKDHY